MSKKRAVLESIALARSNHHHLLDNDLRLPGTLELHRDRPRLGRAATLVTLAHATVLHRVLEALHVL